MKALIEVVSFHELSDAAKASAIEMYGKDVINSYNWDDVFQPYILKSEEMGVTTLLYDISRNSTSLIIYGIVDRAKAHARMSLDGEVNGHGRMLFLQDEPDSMASYISFECDADEALTRAIVQSLTHLSQAMQAALQQKARNILTEDGLKEFFEDLDARFLPDGTWLKVESSVFLPLH